MTLLSSQLAKFFVPESGGKFDLLRAILERLNEEAVIGLYDDEVGPLYDDLST